MYLYLPTRKSKVKQKAIVIRRNQSLLVVPKYAKIPEKLVNVKYRQANRADHQWLVAIWNKTTIKSASHSLCAHTCQSLLDDSLCNPSFYSIRTTARPYFQAIEQQWLVSVTKMWTLTFNTGFIPKQASVLLTICWEIYGTGAIFPVPFPF